MTTSSSSDAFFDGTITKSDLIALVKEVFTAPDFYESCWDEFDVLFQRMVWEFPDGLLLTFAPKEGLAISDIEKELTSGDTFSVALKAFLESKSIAAKFDKDANGYRLTQEDGDDLSPEKIVELIDDLAQSHGSPILNLPWEDRIGNIADESEDYLEDEDTDEQLRASYRFFSQLNDLGELPALPWDARLNDSDSLMPAFSSWGRFYRLLEVLAEEKQWIVINSECCGTCAAGSIRDVKENQPELANAPSLVVYEQNAEGKWGALGWVAHFTYLEAPESFELEAVAKELGLRLVWDGAPGSDFFVIS